MADLPKIFPLGDDALNVDFGNEISLELNNRAIALAGSLNSDPFRGFVEAVPAYSSVAVFYDLTKVPRGLAGTAFEAVRDLVTAKLESVSSADEADRRLVEIPVDFSKEAALDLDFLAAYSGLSPDEVIETFLAKTYRVYMLGFLPGFAYMGEVDERIAAPRRTTPRMKVPKGALGIAGRQTGIYPLESPGGWQIIGRTDIEMFTPNGKSPCLLQPGDEVRFVPI